MYPVCAIAIGDASSTHLLPVLGKNLIVGCLISRNLFLLTLAKKSAHVGVFRVRRKENEMNKKKADQFPPMETLIFILLMRVRNRKKKKN